MRDSCSVALRCLLGAAFVLFAATPRPAVQQAPETQPPNIILVLTDDQGYGPVGRNGHPWIRTPNLDALHDRSASFSRFLVSPTCAPTRSALMTGRHPMRNGVTHTIVERERMSLEATTTPQVLGGAGYTSGIFGKWHLGDEDAYQPQNRGFDEAFIHGGGGIGQAYKCSCADSPGNKYFDPVVRHNGTFVKTHGFCTDVFFSAALGWIEEVKENEQPFFAYISTNAPHGPFIAPPANRERFEELGFPENLAGFYGMIENIDQNMGRLEQKLREWDLHRSTVVIFMSDNGMVSHGANGELLGQEADGTEMHMYNAGMRGMKGSVDEGGVRVPFLVRWDGHVQAGLEIDAVSAHIDLLPTLAEIAGIDLTKAEFPSTQVEGRSLLRLLLGKEEQPLPSRYLFSHRGRWPTGADPREFKYKGCAVRTPRFRFIDNSALYDMHADPGQTNNVIGEHGDLVEVLRAAYTEWWEGTLPLMVNESAPMSKTRPFHVAYREQLAGAGIPDWIAPELARPQDGAGTRYVFDLNLRPAEAMQLVGEEGHVLIPESAAASQWLYKQGILTASPAWDSLVTPESYRDFRLHVEFNVNDAEGADHEANGNSGIYIQQRYELQILNSFGIAESEYKTSDCGSLYRLKKPDRLVSKPAGQWQSFDILFRAARFDGETKIENARITAYQNQELIHSNVSIERKTGAGKNEGPEALPIKFQGHHNPVRFRNTWIERLSLVEMPSVPGLERETR
ncbi:MAG: arylsulfatase A-like enzyme [Planctomycetota bacterium]|jgi:arylsulfatase A-like enzyme